MQADNQAPRPAREKCGLFGLYNNPEAAALAFLGLYALQHRGQESAGMVVSDGRRLRRHVGMGQVSEVFRPEQLGRLPGHAVIGHTRYSTTGSSNLVNAQPFTAHCRGTTLAVAHNGNFTNTGTLRRELEERGAVFQSTTDSELVSHLVSHSRCRDFPENIADALARVEGAYCLLLMTAGRLFAARDPHGFRPLCLGRLNGGWAVASESSALDIIDATYEREIEPGEIVSIDERGPVSHRLLPRRPSACCVFEQLYFARPDSRIFGGNVYLARKKLGARLAAEAPAAGDLVMPVPDSGVYAAIGYSQASGLPFEMGFIRNHYVGRTFIHPVQRVRDLGVKIKLNPVRELVRGRDIVLIDDSIVRGTTSRSRVQTLRDFGARRIHMRVACPPHRFPCWYGIDFPDPDQLVANRMSLPEIERYLKLDSLAYLSFEGMMAAMPRPAGDFCAACFTGDYPVAPEPDLGKSTLER